MKITVSERIIAALLGVSALATVFLRGEHRRMLTAVAAGLAIALIVSIFTRKQSRSN